MKRGRKSIAEKSILSLVNIEDYKPPAPKDLTPDQKQVWCDIVESMRPGTFPPSVWALLHAYCIHVCRCRFVVAQLHKVDPKTDFKNYRAWASIQRSETQIICHLSTKLRLLPKTNTRRDNQVSTASGHPLDLRRKKPWESDAEEDGGNDAA